MMFRTTTIAVGGARWLGTTSAAAHDAPKKHRNGVSRMPTDTFLSSGLTWSY